MNKLLCLILLFHLSLRSQVTESEVRVSPLINGTLFSPASKPNTLMILIAGSGPTNRSGNQVGVHNNSLRYLSQELAARGIAVYAYDKRLFAQMAAGTADEKTMRFDDGIADAKDVLQYFKKENKFKKIVIAGHSEGSLVGMSAAPGLANGFISIAGAGRPADEVLHEQIAKVNPAKSPVARAYLDRLKNGQTFKLENEPFLEMLFRESVQPYMISWIRHDPSKIIAQLKMPVLIVNGTKDLQVPESEARLLQKAKPDADLVIIENMNHVLKEISGGDTENQASYSDPQLPVSPALVEAIAAFIKEKV